MQMRALGAGFEGVPQFDVNLTNDSAQVVVDLAALKTQPGDYTLAFHGGAVAKYRPPTSGDAKAPAQEIVDIIVTEPITLRVQPAESK